MPINSERREQIADAALEVLATEGAHGLTHRAVDARAGREHLEDGLALGSVGGEAELRHHGADEGVDHAEQVERQGTVAAGPARQRTPVACLQPQQ